VQPGAVTDRKSFIIETMDEDGLGMKRVDQVDALIVLSGPVGGAFVEVGAMENNETRRRSKCPSVSTVRSVMALPARTELERQSENRVVTLRPNSWKKTS
jgi:hypothetical protein